MAAEHFGGHSTCSSYPVPDSRYEVPLTDGRSSIPTHHPDHDPLDRDVVFVHVHRCHRLVGRLESDAAVALAVELLHRGRVAMQHRDDHLAVVGALAFVHDDKITVADLLLDHRVAANPQDIMIAGTLDHAVRHRDGFLVRHRLDRHARRDGAEEGKLDGLGYQLARQDLDRAALVVRTLDEALPLE